MKRALLLCVLAACAKSKDSAPASTTATGPENLTVAQATEGLPGDGKLMAEFATDLGSIHCQLLPEAAPETVASFVGLARGLKPFQDPASGKWVKRPFFDGLAFHRVIPRFMIQGGDPLSAKYDDPAIGTGGPGYTLPDELDANLKFDKPGVLAMANTGPRTHSGGSQFFITERPTPQLNGGYVVFGQCEDDQVVQAIARVTKSGGDKPTTPVTMKVKIYKK